MRGAAVSSHVQEGGKSRSIGRTSITYRGPSMKIVNPDVLKCRSARAFPRNRAAVLDTAVSTALSRPFLSVPDGIGEANAPQTYPSRIQIGPGCRESAWRQWPSGSRIIIVDRVPAIRNAKRNRVADRTRTKQKVITGRGFPANSNE